MEMEWNLVFYSLDTLSVSLFSSLIFLLLVTFASSLQSTKSNLWMDLSNGLYGRKQIYTRNLFPSSRLDYRILPFYNSVLTIEPHVHNHHCLLLMPTHTPLSISIYIQLFAHLPPLPLAFCNYLPLTYKLLRYDDSHDQRTNQRTLRQPMNDLE